MNRVERMQAMLSGSTPDRPPVGMWFHNDPSLTVEQAVDAHFNYTREVGMDIIKIMYDNDYLLDTPISTPSDWRRIRPRGKDSEFYRKQRDILRRLVERVGGEYHVWMTMFGAFKFAVMATSDELVMAHSREDPDALAAGVSAIADTLCEWADGYFSEGADAIFYSAQFAEIGRFSKPEWEKLVKPYDLRVMQIAEQAGSGRYNALHLCGEPEYGYKVHIDRFADYPGALVNWAIYPNQYGIERGRDLFARPVMGGLNNHGVMAHGSPEEVAEAVRELLQAHGRQGFMIGADCSIESPECRHRVKAVVEAANAFYA